MLEVQLDHRYCPTCESEQLFEAPLCQDGHGANCPDLACVTCGTALFVVVISDTATPAPGSARESANTRRSA
jgi:hypothetical protein